MPPWWQMSLSSRSYANCCLYTVCLLNLMKWLTWLIDWSFLCRYARFLNGRCKNSSCPYSHDLTPGKVPTCSYFMKGACGQDNCPYAHSFVGADAQICDDFVQGFCAKGIEVCEKSMKLSLFFSYLLKMIKHLVSETTCSFVSAIRINWPMPTW